MPPTNPNDPKGLYDALMDPTRINALKDCDKNLSNYDPYSFLLVFRIRGRHFPMIILPLACLLLWDLVWGLYLITFDDPLGISEPIQSMESLIVPILMPVSFLLVFRLGRAAVRYWDARAAMGKVVEVCRTTMSTALGASNQQQGRRQLAQDYVRWVAVFPIAVKNFLRPWEGVACNRTKELGAVLSREDQLDFLATKGETLYAPVLVLNRLRQLAFQLAHSNTTENKDSPHDAASLNGMLYRQLNEQIDTLTGAWGAMERINGTPLPFVYVVHLRTFLLLHLFLWHMEAIASNGWIALLPLQLASWGLLGIEAAAVECERPFAWHSNHLALGKACIVVARNLAQTLQNLGWTKSCGSVGQEKEEGTQVKVRLGPLQPAECTPLGVECSA